MVTIEGAWGLGSAVVGGEVTPDRWVVGKITGEISVRDITDKHIPSAGASRRSRRICRFRESASRAVPGDEKLWRSETWREKLSVTTAARRTSSGPSTAQGEFCCCRAVRKRYGPNKARR